MTLSESDSMRGLVSAEEYTVATFPWLLGISQALASLGEERLNWVAFSRGICSLVAIRGSGWGGSKLDHMQMLIKS